MKSGRLEDLTNLDSESAGLLREAGIGTPEMLREVGAIGAYLACREAFEELDDFELLFRLDGAIRGVDWQEIPPHDREQMHADAQQALTLGEF